MLRLKLWVWDLLVEPGLCGMNRLLWHPMAGRPLYLLAAQFLRRGLRDGMAWAPSSFLSMISGREGWDAVGRQGSRGVALS